MKTILLWDPRFPDAKPRRLTLDDTLASACVRAGVAAAADPAEAGALAAGGALSPADLTPVVLQHGRTAGLVARVLLPAAVAAIGVGLGLVASVGAAITGVAPPPTPTITGTLPAVTAGQPYDVQLTVTPPGTAVSLSPGFAAALASHGITHDGFGRFTSSGVTL